MAKGVKDGARFRAALDRLTLTQTEFTHEVQRLGGAPMPLRTVQAWALSERRVPPSVWALLALMERAPGTWRAT